MKLLTVTFKLVNGDTLIATDVQGGVANASNALREFKAGKIAKVVTGGGDTYLVPFHAVVSAKVEETSGTVTPGTDANCNYTCDC